MTEVINRVFRPRGAALDLFHCRASETLICGPAGTGKSRAALEKIHMMMLVTPGSKALLLRKTHVSLSATGLATFRDHVLAEALTTGLVRWYGGSGEKPPGYVYGNGSFVAVGGLDNPTKIMSSEYDVIYVQEATELTKDDWEKVTTRLRNGKISFQQLIADCNPDAPTHWLKLRCDDGTTTELLSRHEDNPRLFDDLGVVTIEGTNYLSKLDALTGVRYLRLRKGIWAAAEGLIYEEWDPFVHLTDRKVLPKEWRRIWSVDFGYTNPFVWQMWAIDPDGRLWLEKEIYRTQTIVQDHAKEILSVVTMKDGKTWKYPRPEKIICDHDAEDRATLERELDTGTTAAKKDVSPGIQAMQQRLRPAGDGKARMFICRDSLVSRDQALIDAGKPIGFKEEITGYVWKKPPRASTIGQEKPEPDEPLKLHDHSMDAARYVVADQDGISMRVRFL